MRGDAVECDQQPPDDRDFFAIEINQPFSKGDLEKGSGDNFINGLGDIVRLP